MRQGHAPVIQLHSALPSLRNFGLALVPKYYKQSEDMLCFFFPWLQVPLPPNQWQGLMRHHDLGSCLSLIDYRETKIVDRLVLYSFWDYEDCIHLCGQPVTCSYSAVAQIVNIQAHVFGAIHYALFDQNYRCRSPIL